MTTHPLTPEVLEQVRRFLASSHTLSLATVADDGRPYAANLRYAHDDELQLYWVSSDDAAHSRHLTARPDAAVTIYHPSPEPDEIRGLQLRGIARALTRDADRHLAWELYASKFPSVTSNPAFAELIASQQFARFRPTWVRWIDNRRSFGFKAESDWPIG